MVLGEGMQVDVQFKPVPLDKAARAATRRPLYIVGAVALLYATTMYTLDRILMTPFLILGLFVLLILSGGLWTPRRYLVSDQTVRVGRLIGDITIPLSEVVAVKAVDQIPVAGQWFGSGGSFGYTGKFVLADGKTVTLYCTNLARVVLITTAKKTYGLSPEDADGFCRAVSSNT